MGICGVMNLKNQINMKRSKYQRNKVLDLELMRNKLASGIYLDHAINAIGEAVAEKLHDNGFIIYNKAEKENGVRLGGQPPLTSHNSIVTKGG